MPAIRYRPNSACATVLGDIPGGKAFVRKSPKVGAPLAAYPVSWLGFICKAGARRLSSSRPGKLVATAITNGDFIAHEWRDLARDEYVVCMLVQTGEAHEFGAFGVVGQDGWPLVRSDTSPRLTVISQVAEPKIAKFANRR